MSKLKSVFRRGEGIDEKIDNAFSPSGASSAKSSFSERVLESQKKFGGQFNGASAPKKFGESLPSTFSGSSRDDDFGRFDPDFVPERHLDDFDETKNIENFRNVEPVAVPPKISPIASKAPVQEFHELATATPRRNAIQVGSAGDLTRVIEELEDVRAQNGEILRRIQRIEEKLRR